MGLLHFRAHTKQCSRPRETGDPHGERVLPLRGSSVTESLLCYLDGAHGGERYLCEDQFSRLIDCAAQVAPGNETGSLHRQKRFLPMGIKCFMGACCGVIVV